MSQSLIESLPSEILSRIFLQISDDEREQNHKEVSIKNLRLVSKRIMTISSSLLVRTAFVYLGSQSFTRLEELCRHPQFHKSIDTVVIDLSYYDVNLARSRRRFVEDCACRLEQTLEMAERSLMHSRRFSRDRDEEEQKLVELRNSKDVAASAIARELRALARHERSPGQNRGKLTDSQQTLVDMHTEYVARANDQEAVRIDNNHIKRLCACLSQLPALNRIYLFVRPRCPPGGPLNYLKDDSIDTLPPPRSFYSFALRTSAWNGTFETAYTTEPPTEMLGELLSQLGHANLRPHWIHVRLSVPADLKCLQINEEQSNGIHNLVSRTSTIVLCFNSWARKGSLAENNDRSSSEMDALGSVMKALTSTSSLKSLYVKLDKYPAFHEFPTVNMSALLPIRSILWPNLELLDFTNVPFDIGDLQMLVDTHKSSLKSFTASNMYLRDDKWQQVLDILRECTDLERVELRYPQGGEYRERRYLPGNAFPRERAEGYVLRLTGLNPLAKPLPSEGVGLGEERSG